MRGSLAVVRRRIARLSKQVSRQNCDQPHVVPVVSWVEEDEPAPERPEDDGPTHCACGWEIEYRHYQYRWMTKEEASAEDR